MGRIDQEHKLANLAVKLRSKKGVAGVSATMIGRAKQAHHGIQDVEITDLEAAGARSWQQFLSQIFGWTVVLMSLAGTVLMVGGVGVLSVMLVSFSDRSYEIGPSKAVGASDAEVCVRLLLEACVLPDAGASVGRFCRAAARCRPCSPRR